VHAGAAGVRAKVRHWGDVEQLDDGTCRLTMQVDDLGWPMFVLAGIGAPFDIEAPRELVERTAAVGAQFTRAAEGAQFTRAAEGAQFTRAVEGALPPAED